MIQKAKDASELLEKSVTSFHFTQGFANDTKLPSDSVDIVTISQGNSNFGSMMINRVSLALHWMEPNSTFTEIKRILKTGGLLAAYDW